MDCYRPCSCFCTAGHKYSTELTYNIDFDSHTPEALEAVAFFSKLVVGSQFDYQVTHNNLLRYIEHKNP